MTDPTAPRSAEAPENEDRSAGPAPSTPRQDESVVVLQKTRRSRGVRFLPWLVTGGFLGLVAGLLIGVSTPMDARYTANTQVAYLGMMGLLLGLLVSGLAAVVVDMVLTRR